MRTLVRKAHQRFRVSDRHHERHRLSIGYQSYACATPVPGAERGKSSKSKMPHSAGRAQTPHSAGRAQPRRRTRGQESRGAPHHGAGGLALEDTRVLHPDKEWTNYEWRAWDKKHGHVLWMGSIQASAAIPSGLFARGTAVAHRTFRTRVC